MANDFLSYDEWGCPWIRNKAPANSVSLSALKAPVPQPLRPPPNAAIAFLAKC